MTEHGAVKVYSFDDHTIGLGDILVCQTIGLWRHIGLPNHRAMETHWFAKPSGYGDILVCQTMGLWMHIGLANPGAMEAYWFAKPLGYGGILVWQNIGL